MISYKILPEHKLVAICMWGKTPVDEIMNLRQSLRVDPDFSPDFDVITDLTHIEQVYSSMDVRKVAETQFSSLESTSSLVKAAVVAPVDFSFGMSRMHEMIADGKYPGKTSVFRDAVSAMIWLERTEIDIESIFEEIRKRSLS